MKEGMKKWMRDIVVAMNAKDDKGREINVYQRTRAFRVISTA